jgi:regulator of replication initiation timing
MAKVEERIDRIVKAIDEIEHQRKKLQEEDHLLHIKGIALRQELKDLREIARLSKKRGV